MFAGCFASTFFCCLVLIMVLFYFNSVGVYLFVFCFIYFIILGFV